MESLMMVLGLFGPIGVSELLIILLILILLFGARKIPDLARGLGEGIRNFRSGMKETENNDDEPEKKDELTGGSG
jgi:sec-independent protein translocase protein TatA